jgi:hypothetical protein
MLETIDVYLEDVAKIHTDASQKQSPGFGDDVRKIRVPGSDVAESHVVRVIKCITSSQRLHTSEAEFRLGTTLHTVHTQLILYSPPQYLGTTSRVVRL